MQSVHARAKAQPKALANVCRPNTPFETPSPPSHDAPIFSVPCSARCRNALNETRRSIRGSPQFPLHVLVPRARLVPRTRPSVHCPGVAPRPPPCSLSTDAHRALLAPLHHRGMRAHASSQHRFQSRPPSLPPSDARATPHPDPRPAWLPHPLPKGILVHAHHMRSRTSRHARKCAHAPPPMPPYRVLCLISVPCADPDACRGG